MAENSKEFRCDDCGAKEFLVTIEPNYAITDDNKEWLEEIAFCPNCGGDAEAT